jgi:hypothetical protein
MMERIHKKIGRPAPKRDVAYSFSVYVAYSFSVYKIYYSCATGTAVRTVASTCNKWDGVRRMRTRDSSVTADTTCENRT